MSDLAANGTFIGCILIILVCLYWLYAQVRSRDVYTHIKTGTEYVVLYIGKFEANVEKCVVYTAAHDVSPRTVWVRDYNEFFDGRFVKTGRIVWHL